MARDHRRGGRAARSADRRSRGDGRDRRQRGAGAPGAAASPRAARPGRGGVAQDSGLAQGAIHRGRAAGELRADEPAWFDPHLLGRVLRHLLENAAAHTPPGSRITLEQPPQRTTGWSSCVEDNGPGIDALDLPLIFEKFYRGKRGGKQAQRIGDGPGHRPRHSAAHGGGIEASSMPGKRRALPLLGAAGGERAEPAKLGVTPAIRRFTGSASVVLR